MDIEKANVLLNHISKNSNYELVCDYTIADMIIIYTCAFGMNKMYSMRVIADVRLNAKEEATVVITGCLTKICSDELKKIPDLVLKPFSELINLFAPGTLKSLVPLVPQNKVIISEGCLHKCSYCVYPLIVENYKSKPIEEILNEVERLYEAESTIYITGEHETSDYGIDLYGKRCFAILLEKILSKFPNSNFVIGWFNPYGLSDEIISVMAKYNNVVEIMLHIQHVENSILKNMNRAPIEITDAKIKKLKNLRPDIIISTEVIVGFPGETDTYFCNLVDYLDKGYFDDVGVASYEAVPGTKAVTLPNQVPYDIKVERMNFIKERYGATCYPSDNNSSKSIISEYINAYNILSNRPKNILLQRQVYNKIAGVDTKVKMEEFESHIADVLKRIISSRSEFDFEKNRKYLLENYTLEAREFFYLVISSGDFKDRVKQRAKKLLC